MLHFYVFDLASIPNYRTGYAEYTGILLPTKRKDALKNVTAIEFVSLRLSILPFHAIFLHVDAKVAG